jgi:DNA polymerase III gamma/tau subunit
MTIANDQRPKLFKDYVGQLGAVSYLTSAVKHNKHSNGVLITGSPGIGKSTLAYLYTRATLCEQREEGSFEPCNKCHSCSHDISNLNHPNITYYRITEATLFREAVNDLIAMTKAKPALTHDNIRTDNLRRFIIIDEVQSATKQSISPFLDSLEFASDDVTVILISMDLDSMDKTVKDAIESRCIELSLDPLNEKDISDSLCNNYLDLNKDAANLIAYLSKGNVRQAWSLLEYFLTQVKAKDITSNLISTQKLNSLTDQKVEELIDAIENRGWLETEKLVNRYLNDSINAVNYLLLRILQNKLDIHGVELISTLSFWLQSNYKIPLIAVFRPFQNKKLTLKEEVKVIKPVIISTTTEDIAAQLGRITGAPVIVKEEHKTFVYPPEWFRFISWRNFLDNYADS